MGKSNPARRGLGRPSAAAASPTGLPSVKQTEKEITEEDLHGIETVLEKVSILVVLDASQMKVQVVKASVDLL